MATKTNTTINGKDYYRIRRKIDGKIKSFYGTSKGDAEKKYRDYIENKNSKDTFIVVATFHNRAIQFIDDVVKVSNKYAESTRASYLSAYFYHIENSLIDDMRMGDLHPSDVQRFYNSLDVSAPTLRNVHNFFKSFCKWAVLNGYSGDFMSAVELPKKPANKRKNKIVTWEDDEIKAILNEVESPKKFRLYFLIYVLLYTGARISEALALKYDDLSDSMVRIDKQYYMGEIKPPKYNSGRSVPMHEELIRAFEIHRAWHEKEMRENNYDTDYVFTTKTGNLYLSGGVRSTLNRLYKRIDVPQKTPHAYRATFCTQLCRCGVPIEVASALLGHKRLEVTAAHYALVKKDTKETAIAKLHYKN